MKLSISNIAWDKMLDEQIYDLCRKMGYQSIEIAPSRVFLIVLMIRFLRPGIGQNGLKTIMV